MEYRIIYRTHYHKHGIFFLLSIALISITIFCSCSPLSFFDFDQPVITSISPNDQQSLNSANDFSHVEIKFNKKMNEGSVQNSFTLKRLTVENYEETAVSGYFQWTPDGRSMTFYVESILNFGKYRVDLRNNTEDNNGNNLKFGTNTIFYIGSYSTPPSIVYIYPPNNATNLPVSNLIITVIFSEPIDVTHLSTMFSVSPSLNYKIMALSNNTVFKLFPLSTYQIGQYSLSFNTNSITDFFGNPLRPTPSIFFTIGNDFYPPQLIGIYTNSSFTGPLTLTNGLNYIDKFSSLYFVYNKSLSIDLNNVPVTYNPSVAGVWQSNNNGNALIFTPSSYWNIGVNYTVSIGNGIRDVNGNISQDTYQAYMLIDGQNTFFINLNNITCIGSNWTIPAVNKVTFVNTIKVYLYFNSSIQPVTALPDISVSANNSINSTVSIIGIQFLQTSSPNDTICVTITNNAVNTLYDLNIKGGTGGIRDKNQNWLPSDINIYYLME